MGAKVSVLNEKKNLMFPTSAGTVPFRRNGR